MVKCRIQGCDKEFGSRHTRLAHEEKHIKQGLKRKPKKPVCSCCDPPKLFGSLRALTKHKNYKINAGRYVCGSCGAGLSSN